MTDGEIEAELQRRLGRSLFGCDGGNVRAGLWVCGIEFGGDDRALAQYRFTRYGADPPIPYRAPDNIPDQWRRNRYDLRLAWLCVRIFGRDETPQRYLEDRLYNRDSDILKLNLFAYPRRSTGVRWGARAKELTDCGSPSEFRRRCRTARFPLYRRLLGARGPRVILCTGLGCEGDFLAAFTDGDAEAQQPPPFAHRLLIYRAGRTQLIIAPFYRMSGAAVGRLADIIRSLLNRT